MIPSPPLRRSAGATRCLPLATICALALVAALSGCTLSGLIPTVLPPTPTESLVRPTLGTIEPTGTAVTPGPSDPTAMPTAIQTMTPAATPVSTVPGEPRRVQNIALPTHAHPGRDPVAIARLGDAILVANRDTSNVSVLHNGRVAYTIDLDFVPAALTASPDDDFAAVLGVDGKGITVLRWSPLRRLRTSTDISLPERGVALEATGEGLWVALGNSGRLVLYDARSCALLRDVHLPDRSPVVRLLASDTTGELWIVGYGGIWIADSSSGDTQRHISLADAHLPMALHRETLRLYQAGYNRASSRPELRASVVASDSDEPTPLWSVAVSNDISALATSPDGQTVWAISSHGGEIMTVRAQDGVLSTKTRIGLGPLDLAVDPAGQSVHIVTRGDQVVAVGLGRDGHAPTVAGAQCLDAGWDDVDVDRDSGRVFVASGSQDRVYVVENGRVAESWTVGSYPQEILWIPERESLAVLCAGSQEVLLMDAEGTTIARYETGAHPRGLAFDAATGTLYAGDTAVSVDENAFHRVLRTVALGASASPIRVCLDTQRGIAYGAFFNGIPGSNGGYTLMPLSNDGVGVTSLGRLSVVDVLYDGERDLFVSTHSRMGTSGLVLNSAKDGREVAYLRLEGYPLALALNSVTGHVWVAVSVNERTTDTGASGYQSRLIAFDLDTIEVVATIEVDGTVRGLAADPSTSRVYAVDDTQGTLHVIQDVVP